MDKHGEAARVATKEAAIKLVILLALTAGAWSQASILGISSFKSCINQDFSSQTSEPGVGQDGTFLDCTGNETIVTVLDLRLTPASGGSPERFNFNLTVVPDEENRFRTNTDPTACEAGEGQNCQLTDFASIRVTRSRAITYYQLRALFDIRPFYCHLFNQVAATPDYSTTPGAVNPTKVDSCWGWPFWETCNIGQNHESNIQGCQFMQQFNNIEAIAQGCPGGTFCGKSCVNGGTTPQQRRCLLNRSPYWVSRANSSLLTPPRDILERKHKAPYGSMTYFGFDSLRKKNNGVLDFTVPLPDPFPAPIIFSQVNSAGPYIQAMRCFGSNCQGTSNNGMYDVGFEATPEATGPSRVNGRSSTIHITQLEPLCTAYAVDAVPKIAATIEIEVETSLGVETLVLNNISPNVRSSSASKFISGRIVSADTSDGYLGPYVGGVIVVCGGNKTAHSGTQQPSFNGSTSFNYTQNQFWDMRANTEPDGDVQDNPWDVIIEELADIAPEIDRYYPTNLQLNPTNSSESAVMWYWVSPERMTTLNRNCGGLAFTDEFWSTSNKEDSPNRKTAQEACLRKPDLCLPGAFSGPVFDPLFDTGIPGCLAAEAFTLLANSTTRNSLDPERLQLAETIARMSMPPSNNPSNANNYDSSNPQWFIADSNRLYYDPGNLVELSAVNFEVSLDVVGTFLDYTTVVSNGEILLEQVPCEVTQGRVDGRFEFRVRNTGTLAATYTVTITCDPALGIENLPGSIPISVLAPGNTSDLFNISFSQSGTVAPSRERTCLMSLFPGEAVNVFLQNITTTCFVAFPPAPTFAFNDTTLRPSNLTRQDGCDCWDFNCFDSVTDSWCFIGLMIFFGVLGFLFLGALILMIYSQVAYSETRKKVKEAQKRAMGSMEGEVGGPGVTLPSRDGPQPTSVRRKAAARFRTARLQVPEGL